MNEWMCTSSLSYASSLTLQSPVVNIYTAGVTFRNYTFFPQSVFVSWARTRYTHCVIFSV